MDAPNTINVKVRYRSQTYVASAPRGSLRACTASCTAGPEQAVRALARKLFALDVERIALLRKDADGEIWGITP